MSLGTLPVLMAVVIVGLAAFAFVPSTAHAATTPMIAYVANPSINTITPINLATKTAGPPIPAGTTPGGIAIIPDGTTAYVADDHGNTVTPINLATGTTGTPIPAGNSPTEIAITPDARRPTSPTAMKATRW